MKEIKLSKYIDVVFETTSNEEAEWFGYYNYDTLNFDQTKMLCGRSKSESESITKDMTIELGYYDVLTKKWYHIGYSDSWNWQQGSMLQWVPGAGNENKVIYNTSYNNHLESVVHDIVTKEDKRIDWPIYGITPDGRKSITLNFERSYWCRAYHYKSVANKEQEGRVIKSDGIFEVDLVNNTCKRIISIEEVIAINDEGIDFSRQKHWLEHIMINPSGTKFCFLHRFSPVNDVYSYSTRLCIANIDGSSLMVAPSWDQYLWSHFGWQNSDSFVIYTHKLLSLQKATSTVGDERVKSHRFNWKQYLKKILVFANKYLPSQLSKLAKGNNKYYQYYKIKKDGSIILDDNIIKPFFDIDGHPSFTSDGKYMITDSYPDKKGRRRLIVYNMVNKKGIVIGLFPENSQPNNADCDLHPKLCKNNSFLAVDSTYKGKHGMILMRFNWELLERDLA